MHAKLTALVLTSFLSAPLAAQGQVLVVDDDGGPGVDFTNPQDAIDAASDGDTVLIEDGEYAWSFPAPATIDVNGKALVIAASSSGKVTIRCGSFAPGLRVTGIAPGQTVVVRGLFFELSDVPFPDGATLVGVYGNEGDVRIEACELNAITAGAGGGGGFPPALHVIDSDAVTFTRGVVFTTDPVSPAVRLQDSDVSFYETLVRGSDGVLGEDLQNDAGPGVVLDGGTLFLADTVVEGGDGAPGLPPFAPCADGGDGGHGIHLLGAAPTVYVYDSFVFGGSADAPSGPPCVPGTPGSAFQIDAGQVVTIPGAARSLRAVSPVHEENSVFVSLRGQPFDAAAAIFSLAPEKLLLFPFPGELLVQPPFGVVALTTLDEFGLGSTFVPLGALPPGVEAATVHVQGLFLDTGGQGHVGSASATTILDASI